MTNSPLPAVRRDAAGHWLGSGNPSGRPARVKEIEALAQQSAPAAFRKIVELLEHRDGKVALAAANAILDRAYGRPVQAVQAQVEKLDIGALYLAALKMNAVREGVAAQQSPTTTIDATTINTDVAAATATTASPNPAGGDGHHEW